MVDASLLESCSDEVPLLGVTREFDFGQFIELFDTTEDPNHPDVPTVARVVIQPNARLAAARAAAGSGGSGGARGAGRGAVPVSTPVRMAGGSQLSRLRLPWRRRGPAPSDSRTATEGQRNDTLNRAAFVLGQFIPTGVLAASVVRDELLSAAGRIGLGRREAERTIESGLTAGTRYPRQRP